MFHAITSFHCCVTKVTRAFSISHEYKKKTGTAGPCLWLTINNNTKVPSTPQPQYFTTSLQVVLLRTRYCYVVYFTTWRCMRTRYCDVKMQHTFPKLWLKNGSLELERLVTRLSQNALWLTLLANTIQRGNVIQWCKQKGKLSPQKWGGAIRAFKMS